MTPQTGATTLNPGSGAEENARQRHPFLKYFQGCLRVVDLGSGVGGFTQLLTRDGAEVICVDSCPEAVQQCRRRGHSAICADAVEFLAAHPLEFDGIWCAHLVEHLVPAAAQQLVRHAHAALRDGGVFVILTPNAADVSVMGEAFREDPAHVRPYPSALLQGMLTSAGFGVEDAGETPVGWLQSLGWLKRLATRGRGAVSRAIAGRHFNLGDIYIIARKGGARE